MPRYVSCPGKTPEGPLLKKRNKPKIPGKDCFEENEEKNGKPEKTPDRSFSNNMMTGVFLSLRVSLCECPTNEKKETVTRQFLGFNEVYNLRLRDVTVCGMQAERNKNTPAVFWRCPLVPMVVLVQRFTKIFSGATLDQLASAFWNAPICDVVWLKFWKVKEICWTEMFQRALPSRRSSPDQRSESLFRCHWCHWLQIHGSASFAEHGCFNGGWSRDSYFCSKSWFPLSCWRNRTILKCLKGSGDILQFQRHCFSLMWTRLWWEHSDESKCIFLSNLTNLEFVLDKHDKFKNNVSVNPILTFSWVWLSPTDDLGSSCHLLST